MNPVLAVLLFSVAASVIASILQMKTAVHSIAPRGAAFIGIVMMLIVAVEVFMVVQAVSGAHVYPVEAVVAVFSFSLLFLFGAVLAVSKNASRRRLKEAVGWINECLLNFGPDPDTNIRSLTDLGQRIFAADVAVYYRFEGDRAVPVALQETLERHRLEDLRREDFTSISCEEVGRCCVIHDLLNAVKPETKELIERLGAKSLVGQPVSQAGDVIGWLVLVSAKKLPIHHFELERLGIIGAAIGVEESRRSDKEQLRRSQEKYEHLYRHADVGLHMCSIDDGRVVECNQKFAQMHGYESPEECIGDLVLSRAYVDPDWREEIVAEMKDSGGKDYSCESELYRKDGGTFWARATGRLYPERGVIEGVTTDVTEQKETEEAFRRERELLNDIIRFNPYGIGIYDIDGRFLQGNEALRQLIGDVPPPEYSILSDMHLGELGVLEELKKVQQGEVVVLPEFWYNSTHVVPCAPSKNICVRVTGFPTRTRDGEVERLIFMFQDVSDQKRVEEAHALLATAVEQLAEIVIITDTEGTVQYVNPAFEKVTGYTEGEIIGQNPRILNSGQHKEEFFHDLWDTIGRGAVWSNVIINRRKDGTVYEEEATISPLRDSSGRIVNYVAVKRDVTIEQQVRQMQRMEAVGRLAGGIAHDFNNLLTGIMGNTEFIQMDIAEDDPIRPQVNEIASTVDRAARLVRQLLVFSKTAEATPHVLNLNEILAGIRSLLDRVIGENIEIITMPGPDLNNIRIDNGQMEQVIVNLAVNARDAMPDGGTLVIETQNTVLDDLYVRNYPGIQSGDYVMLTVSDTGIGMSEETRSRIFEPFFTTKAEQGTGLGLATVYGIVRQAGGGIVCYSEIGKGTTFRLYFPVVKEQTSVMTDTHKRNGTDLRGRETILLVEDDPVILSISSRVLRHHDYTVIAAETAQQALDALNGRTHIDLILTDVVLPDMHGQELVRELHSRGHEFRVVYTSGYFDATIAGKERLGEDINFIQKPYRITDLLQEIRRVLD